MASAKPVERSKGSSECPYHEDKDVDFVCKDCNNILICQTCMIELHPGHSVIELGNIFPKKVRIIQKFIKKCEQNYVPKLNDKIQNIQEKLHDNSTKILNIISQIKKHGESLKAEIDAVTETMVTRCKDLYKENRTNIATYKTELLALHDDIENKVQDCKQVLQSGNKLLVFDFEQDLPRPDHAEIPVTPILLLVDFTPGFIFSQQDLDPVFGALTIRDEMCREVSTDEMSQGDKGIVTSDDLFVNFPFENQTSMKRSQGYEVSSENSQLEEKEEPEMPKIGDILYEFQYSHTIDSLTCEQFKNCCALLEKGSKEVDYVNEEGKIKHTVASKTVITDICISPITARLWLCTNDIVIEKAPANIPALKLRPGNDLCSVCVTVSDHVIVGSPLKVIIYNLEGKKRRKSKPGLIAFPKKLTSCSKTNKIAVVDTDPIDFGGKDEPHVKVLTPTLEFLFKITGETILQRETTKNDNEITSYSIDPKDICFDSMENLLVAEAAGCSIHVVNMDGNFIRTFHQDNLPPVAIQLQRNTNLWVGYGDNSKVVKVIKYQD